MPGLPIIDGTDPALLKCDVEQPRSVRRTLPRILAEHPFRPQKAGFLKTKYLLPALTTSESDRSVRRGLRPACVCAFVAA